MSSFPADQALVGWFTPTGPHQGRTFSFYMKVSCRSESSNISLVVLVCTVSESLDHKINFKPATGHTFFCLKHSFATSKDTESLLQIFLFFLAGSSPARGFLANAVMARPVPATPVAESLVSEPWGYPWFLYSRFIG
jgi:hypothetical protein